MRIAKIIFYLLIILLGISFAALNASNVKINFYIATWTMPVSVLAIIMLSVGIVCGLIISMGKFWRLKREIRKMRDQLKLTEKEIKNLRSIPLRDQH